MSDSTEAEKCETAAFVFLERFVENAFEKATDSERKIERLKTEIRRKERLCGEVQSDSLNLFEDPDRIQELYLCPCCNSATLHSQCPCTYHSPDSEGNEKRRRVVCETCPAAGNNRLCEGCGGLFCLDCSNPYIIKTSAEG